MELKMIEAKPLLEFFERESWKQLLTHEVPLIREFRNKEGNLLRKTAMGAHSILDVGCGSGDSIAPIADNDISIFGIDFSSRQIKNAMMRFMGYPNISLRRGDLFQMLPQWTNKFDVVTFLGAGFGNIIDKEGALKEMLRVVKPRGKVIVTVYSMNAKDAQREWYASVGLPLFSETDDVTMIEKGVFSERFTPEKLKKIATEVGCYVNITQLTPISYVAVFSP